MPTKEATEPPAMLTRLTRSATGKLPPAARSATTLTAKKVTKAKERAPTKKQTERSKTLSSAFKVNKSTTSTLKDGKTLTLTSALKIDKSTSSTSKDGKALTDALENLEGKNTAKPKQVSTFVSPPLPPGPAPPAPPLLYLNADEIQANFEQGKAHLLKVDPRLQNLLHKNPDIFKIYTPEALQAPLNPFASLASGIISQQVSGAAARSIKSKFLSLFPSQTPPTPNPTFPTPYQVLATPLPLLRSAGLSTRKAEYLHSLASHFLSSPHLLSSTFFLTAPDAAIITELTQIRGIGEWSVQMFLLFELRRWDVFSVGDLGVQRGCAIYKREKEGKGKAAMVELLKGGKGKWKFMTEGEMRAVGEAFAPWRSLWCLCAWKVSDTGVESLGG